MLIFNATFVVVEFRPTTIIASTAMAYKIETLIVSWFEIIYNNIKHNIDPSFCL
jgi:hypothetical protein